MVIYNTSIVLNTCPPPIPERKGQRHTFLESILQAYNTLTSSSEITVRHFLDTMLLWAGREPQKSKRYLQNVLNAYYLIGITPYVTLPRDEKRQITSCLNSILNLQKLRLYCIESFFARLARTEVFWSFANSTEPFSTAKLCAELQPLDFSFDDIARRTRLLTNLGVFFRQGNNYRISPLGRTLSCAPVQTAIKPLASAVREPLGSDDYLDSLDTIDWGE